MINITRFCQQHHELGDIDGYDCYFGERNPSLHPVELKNRLHLLLIPNLFQQDGTVIDIVFLAVCNDFLCGFPHDSYITLFYNFRTPFENFIKLYHVFSY